MSFQSNFNMADEVTSNSRQMVFEYAFTDDNVDCRFKFVDEITSEVKQFAAHQKVLAAISPVFRAMFGGSWNDAKNPIVIRDASYEWFAVFMEYFYKDKVTVTVENACCLLELADKYDVKPLVDQCETFLIAQMSVANVLAYYEVAVRHKRDRLKPECHALFRHQYSAIMKSADFCGCSKATLAAFLAQLPIPCDVAEVFNACIKWSKAECEKYGIAVPSMNDLRSALGDCFGLIRFKHMDHQAFVDLHETYKKMFTREEAEGVLVHLLRSVRARYQVEPLAKCKLTFSGRREHRNIPVFGNLRFKISKPLLLYAVTATITCQNNRATDFSATIVIRKGGQELLRRHVAFTPMKRRFTLPSSIVIDAGIVCEILISRTKLDQMTVDAFTHKRQCVSGVNFTPIQRDRDAESIEDEHCSVEAIEFVNFEG